MKKIKLIVTVLVVGFFLAGCDLSTGNGDNKGGIAKKTPGKFSATVLSDTIGRNSSARSVSLGTYEVANSRNIYFILRNIGDFPITDVTLIAGKLLVEGGSFEPITDNGVTASPSSITVLETSGKTSVEMVVEVDINHGNVIGLISQNYIHKIDFKGTTLRIAGKTQDEYGTVLDVFLDVDIETLIKVCSFEVYYSEDNGVTWTKAKYEEVPYSWSEGEPYYLIPDNSKNFIKIKNTGNVPLQYKVWKNGENNQTWENYEDWVYLNAGSFSNILEYKRPTGSNWFVIDTLGTVFDNGGFEDLTFRANTSIVTSSFNTNLFGIGFFILYVED